MKIYRGEITAGGPRVFVEVGAPLVPLDPRLDLANHSPDGFSWGYGGSGPAQTALALLADALGDDQRALAIYQDFKWQVINHLSIDEGWALSDNMVRVFAARIEGKRAAA